MRLKLQNCIRKDGKLSFFFKWIKQHLRVKRFYGTSLNAVKTQIWIAISTYVLIAIMKKELKLSQSLYTILQILSVTIFEKTPIFQLLSNVKEQNENYTFSNTMSLFDL